MTDARVHSVAQHAATVPGAEVEICGRWVWVSFETKPKRTHIDRLKAVGFRYARKKQKWYFAGCAGGGKGRPFSMDQIRTKYGSFSVDEV